MLHEALQKQLIEQGRAFTTGYRLNDLYNEEFESDQDLKKPQPPLVKSPMRPDSAALELPMDFDGLAKGDLTDLLLARKSNRVYTQEPISLRQLSYLLWATQGIKDIRGKAYATIRTVPCGGARHEFETYLLVRNVEGLEPGAYHYLPMGHKLEFLYPVADLEGNIADTLSGQNWAAKASVVFYWSMVPYRAEWRYGIYAHRITMMDIGHVGENLYLAATALGLGTCGIGAFQHELCCRLFGLDDKEEYIVYTAPVGTIREADLDKEKAFYKFVEDEGL